MTLFNTFKNDYFSLVATLINEMVQTGQPMTKKEIHQRLMTTGFDEPYPEFESALTGLSNTFGTLNILKAADGGFFPEIDTAIPVQLNASELQWMKMMLSDKRIQLHLDQDLIHQLQEIFDYYDIKWDKSLWIERNINDNNDDPDNEHLRTNIKTFSEAVNQGLCIKYHYTTMTGIKIEGHGRPHRIEYSPRNNRYMGTILVYDEANHVHRIIKVIMANLIIDTTIALSEDLTDQCVQAFYENKKNQTNPLVLKVVTDEVKAINILDRCFHRLSYYDKSAYINKNDKTYYINIDYYDFDERELIRDILSFGSSVVVIEPEHIRKKVINIYRQRYASI